MNFMLSVRGVIEKLLTRGLNEAIVVLLKNSSLVLIALLLKIPFTISHAIPTKIQSTKIPYSFSIFKDPKIPQNFEPRKTLQHLRQNVFKSALLPPALTNLVPRVSLLPAKSIRNAFGGKKTETLGTRLGAYLLVLLFQTRIS